MNYLENNHYNFNCCTCCAMDICMCMANCSAKNLYNDDFFRFKWIRLNS